MARRGFEPPTTRMPVGCITTRPLLRLGRRASLLLGAASATDKKPKLCYLSECLLAGSGTDWLTVNLSSRCTAEGNRILVHTLRLVRFMLPHGPCSAVPLLYLLLPVKLDGKHAMREPRRPAVSLWTCSSSLSHVCVHCVIHPIRFWPCSLHAMRPLLERKALLFHSRLPLCPLSWIPAAGVQPRHRCPFAPETMRHAC